MGKTSNQYEDDVDGCWMCENQDNCANCELYKHNTAKQTQKQNRERNWRKKQNIKNSNFY